MKSLTRAWRLLHIQWIVMRYNLDEFVFITPWFLPFRGLRFLNPWYWTVRNTLTRGERLRLALVALGPIFVKAGQVLSTRRDLLPDDISDELAKLQDRVPPFSGKLAATLVEKALGNSLDHFFLHFDEQALASASIAQVHAVTLLDGRSAVAKVLRPGIQKKIESDLDLLGYMAQLADKYLANARYFKPKELVAEIASTLHDELDLLREGANASQLRRNFTDSPLLYVPEIYWTYSRASVLVMERIEGIPVHNIDGLKASGINLKKLAERGVEVFFTQVFRDSFFHADMHPGNIFVCPKNKENPQYIAVDFGIVGSLNSRDQRYLAENMLAFFKRDYQRVAELHISSGWLPPDTRIDQFEGAIRAVCEPIFARPVKDISFGQLLLRLFQTARRFNINIQPQLILLQKTLLNIEGVGSQIYPDLNIWTTAGPYLEKWIKQQVGPRAFLRKVKNNFPIWAEKLPDMPGLIFEALSEYRYTQEKKRFDMIQEIVPPRSHLLQRLLLGLGTGFVFSALLINYQPVTLPTMIYILGGAGILFFLLAVVNKS